MTERNPPTTPPPAAPPTTPGALTSPERPAAWPAVIGVISIILGAVGIAQGTWGVVTPLLFRAITSGDPAGSAVSPWDAFDRYMAALLALSAATVLVASLLLCSGICLARRRPAGARLAVLWAVLKVLFAGGAAAVAWFVQVEMDRRMSGQANPPPAGTASMVWTTSTVGTAVTAAWLSLYPAFMLIWFSRPHIREEVRRWRAAAAAPVR